MLLQKSLQKLDDFPKISKANSLLINNTIFYIKKENGIYKAWLYPSGELITVGITKEKIERLINDRWEKVKALLQQ